MNQATTNSQVLIIREIRPICVIRVPSLRSRTGLSVFICVHLWFHPLLFCLRLSARSLPSSEAKGSLRESAGHSSLSLRKCLLDYLEILSDPG